MITITPISKPLFLLNEEILIEATGSRKTISTGTPASLDIHFTSMAVNDYFTLTINNQILRFTAVATPDDSGLQVTACADHNIILADLKNNYFLSNNYTLMIISGIHLESKFPGSRFTIVADMTNSPNVASANNVAGVDPLANDNYGILYSIEEKNTSTGEYIELASFVSCGSDSIRVLIDQFLSKIKWNYQLPSFNDSSAIYRTDLIRTFRIKLSERFGSPAQAQRIYQTNNFSVVKYEIPGVISSDFDIYTWFRYSKRFLSDQPVIRRTWYRAPQFLTFFTPLMGTNLYKIKIVTMDAAYNNTISDLYSLSLSQNDIIQIPCSADLLNLPSGTIQYQLYVECRTAPFVGQILINLVTFNIVAQTEFGRSFIYLNAYGAWETLLSLSTMKTDLKTTRVQLINEVTKSSIVDSKIETYEISTGRMTHAEAVALRDALSSEQFFLAGSNAFIPVVLEPGSFTITDEFDDLSTCKFSYTYSDLRLRDKQYDPDATYFEKIGFTSDFFIN